jgi:prepilin-type N-terminal cleavage/methylation domain-containing protein/prepilin-type processing-associated H-X9-DG protein
MQSRRRAQPAFTLIELLVVISIIAVLLALLMPTISRAREQAQRAVCASQFRQFMIMLTNYDMAYKYYPYGHYSMGNCFYYPASATIAPQYVAMKREFGMTEKIVNCPSLRVNPLMTRTGGGDYRNDINESVLYLGIMYVAGNGSHYEIAGAGASTFTNGYRLGDWPANSAGYYPTCGEVNGGAYKPILPDRAMKQKLPPSRQFIAHDYAYGPNTVRDNRWPVLSAHTDSQGYVAEGQNMLYQDGHVTWIPLILGQSWSGVGNSDMVWFNDPIPVGTSPVLVD